jgi:hypothetical protein
MTQIYRIIFQLSWILGLLSMLGAAIVKLAHLAGVLNLAPHTGFVAAGVFFLCALATREMQRLRSPQ